MDSGRRVGVIVPAHVLRRNVGRRPTWEEAFRYSAAAKEFDLQVVLFTLKAYNPRRGTVRGYVRRGGGWKRWNGPLPRVIHNRIIPQTSGSFRLLRTLTKRLGPALFNPPVSRDKWRVWRRIADSEELTNYLPPTWPLSRKLCQRLPDLVHKHRGLVIKPRHGGLGQGILFIEPASEGRRRQRFRVTPTVGRRRVIGRQALRRLVRRRIGLRGYIVQETVPLAKYRGRRCDVRVPVQRGGDGKWRVEDATVKRAGRHRYLTNIARGGQASPYRRAVGALFGARRSAEIWEEISRLSVAVARRLSSHYPQLADLGLDIGIDVAGKPWLIEVNFRDQRLPSKRAGQTAAHAQLYYNPIAYANYLIRRPPGAAVERGSEG